MTSRDHARIAALLSDVSYPGVRIHVPARDGEVYLQLVEELRPDEDRPPMTGRKWRLSQHMTDSEVVQTALLAVLSWEEHEAREKFTYRGRAIFGPHINLDALWEASQVVDARVPEGTDG